MKFDPFRGRGLAILTVLILVNILNFIDRQLPYILIESIRADLGLTDAEIGLMAGVAFAVVYGFGALFLARLADHTSARWVISLGLAFWSIMTAASGLAQNFGHLILARIGVAAGESGTTPAGHAMIARVYPGKRRALVIAIFSLGVPIGSTIGLMMGGWINEVLGWREAFLIIGLPGVLIAILAAFVLPEIPIQHTTSTPRLSTMEAVKYLMKIPTFVHMCAASSLFAIGSYAMNVFVPAFLMRTHYLGSAEAGLILGIVSGVGGMIGTFAGGVLADVLGRKDPRWRQLIPAIGLALCVPISLGAWLTPNPWVCYVLLGFVYLLGMLYFAPTFTVAQFLVPDDMRATAAGMLLFCLTLVGSSVGPYVVGWVSDILAPQFGNLSLRYALCLLAITMSWSAWHFFMASKKLSADLELKGRGYVRGESQ